MKNIKVVLCLTALICILSACENNKMENEKIIYDVNFENENDQMQAEQEEIEQEEIKQEEIDQEEIDQEENQIIESIVPFDLDTLSFQMTLNEEENGKLQALYVIFDGNGNEMQTIENQPYFTKDWYLLYSGNCCNFEDVNFDGYLDVLTKNSGGDVNAYYFVYIWNQEANQFLYSEEASSIANIELNNEKEQIFSIRTSYL